MEENIYTHSKYKEAIRKNSIIMLYNKSVVQGGRSLPKG